MTKRVLSVLLALVLMFSVIAEETPQAEEPVEEVVNVVQEVEKEDEAPVQSTSEATEERTDTRSAETEIEISFKAEPEMETEDSRDDEETETIVEAEVEDEDTEEPEELSEVSEDDEEETTEDSRSDDGANEPTSSEEHTEDDAEPEQTEKHEDASEEESADAGDVTDDDELDERPDRSDGEPTEPDEEEKTETAEEEDADESEKGESEDEGMEDGSEVETEEADQEQTVEELDDETADEVPGGTSVLEEAAAPMPLMVGATWYKEYTAQVKDHSTTLTIADKNSNEEVVLIVPGLPDSQVQGKVYFDNTCIASGGIGVFEDPIEITSDKQIVLNQNLTYGDIYTACKSSSDYTCTISIRLNSLKAGAGVGKVETDIIFIYIPSIDTVTATVSYNTSIDYYPGDPIKATGTLTATRDGESVIDEYSIESYEWYINDEKIDGATSDTYSFYVPDCTTLTIKVIIGYKEK